MAIEWQIEEEEAEEEALEVLVRYSPNTMSGEI